MRCSVRKKYSDHRVMQSTFHEMEHLPHISLNESRCNVLTTLDPLIPSLCPETYPQLETVHSLCALYLC